MVREYGHNLRIMGEIFHSKGEINQAKEFFHKSYEVLIEAGDEYESAKVQLSQAHLFAAEKQWESAYQACTTSEAVFARLDNQADLIEAKQLRQTLEANQNRTQS